MKKILNFFFSNNTTPVGGYGDISYKTASICVFIMFFIMPIACLIWHNVSSYDELKILKKDKQIIDKLDIEIKKITEMEDSIGLAIANNLIDSLEKTIIFAKVKSIKKYGGYWYTDSKTDIKTDSDCLYSCRTKFSHEEELRTACFSKCIKIIKYNSDEYISVWYDTIYTPGVRLKKGITEEFYIKTVAADSASKIAKNKIDSLKINLIQNSNLEDTEHWLMSYDNSGKAYINSTFSSHHFVNCTLAVTIIIYLIGLTIRQIVIQIVIFIIKKKNKDKIVN